MNCIYCGAKLESSSALCPVCYHYVYFQGRLYDEYYNRIVVQDYGGTSILRINTERSLLDFSPEPMPIFIDAIKSMRQIFNVHVEYNFDQKELRLIGNNKSFQFAYRIPPSMENYLHIGDGKEDKEWTHRFITLVFHACFSQFTDRILKKESP